MTSRKTPAKETSHHNRENEDNLDDDRMSSKRASLAQLFEHRAVTREVVSWTPAGPTLRVLK